MNVLKFRSWSWKYHGMLLAVAILALIGYYKQSKGKSHTGDKANYVAFMNGQSKARISQSKLNDTMFWDLKSEYHGLRSKPIPSYYSDQLTCNDFFASWPGDCDGSEDELDERLKLFSKQMVLMNSSLTLYVTGMKGCHFNYPAIYVEQFSKEGILQEFGFEGAFAKMDKWIKTRYTRISDILRIALALKYQKSYVDTDVHFLELQRSIYMVPYVGVGVYSDSKNALEITNAAFCLPQNVLRDMLEFQRNRIVKGNENYFYTELGPSMFHKVLMNRHAVALYSQNSPQDANIGDIANDIHYFGHRQLHLTGRIRKGNPTLGFCELVREIRIKSGLPPIDC